jgi:hypothetical protein
MRSIFAGKILRLRAAKIGAGNVIRKNLRRFLNIQRNSRREVPGVKKEAG